VRSGVEHNERLANDVSALYVSKACLELTSCNELLRPSDLVVEGYPPNGIHEPFSIARLTFWFCRAVRDA
jgi:hypothetical protein